MELLRWDLSPDNYTKTKSITSVMLLFIVLQVSERKIQVLSCGQLGTVLVNRLTRTHTTHRWPWHAAIYHQIGHGSSYQCGGTLINSNAILTAAHCVQVETERITVSLGRLYLDGDDAPFVKVAQIIPHPDYSEENQENDIAIILLSTRATYNNYVQPVCLWSAEKTGFSEIVGKYGTVVGWGRTETGELSNVLQQASFPVATTIDCLKSNRNFFGLFLSDTNFCAGTRNGTSVCTGDSGGSMTFETNGRYYIRGIVSVGPSKRIVETSQIVCDPMQYALFTDVVPYLPWIRRFVDVERLGECETMVRCTWSSDNHRCTAVIHSNTAECQIIFNEIPNPAVTVLTISGESAVIPELTDAVSKFVNLDSLVIANVSLKVVQRDRLTSFPNIMKLNLSSNGISHFDAPDTFSDLTNLEELDISFNKLTNLPAGIFRRNRKMRELYLSSNQLKGVPTDLFEQLVNIELLHLDRNSLSVLPAQIFRKSVKLRELALSLNQLREAHSDLFKELYNLEVSLFNNQLKTIPAGLFRDNRKLTKIYLTNNQLLELHADQFKELSSLEILWLFDNQLETLSADLFHDNRKLRDLRLSKNQLRELHADQFKELYNLEKIILFNNQLETIPAGLFRNNRVLKYIDLQNNKIKKIEPDINRMTLSSLTKLDLSGNVCINDGCGLYDYCNQRLF